MGGDNGGGHHHQNHRPQEVVAHQPQGHALAGHNQGHLAPGNHAHANAGRLVVLVMAQLGAQAATHHLGEHRHHNEGNHHEAGDDDADDRRDQREGWLFRAQLFLQSFQK